MDASTAPSPTEGSPELKTADPFWVAEAILCGTGGCSSAFSCCCWIASHTNGAATAPAPARSPPRARQLREGN
jgi:hypothetical protein